MRTLLGLFDIEDMGVLTDDCAMVGDAALWMGLDNVFRPLAGGAPLSSGGS